MIPFALTQYRLISIHHRLRGTVPCSSLSTHSQASASSILASATEAAKRAAEASVQASIAASKAAEAASAAAEAARLAASVLDMHVAVHETGSSIPVESQPVISPPEQAQETSSSSLAETISSLASSDKDQILDALLPTLLNTPLLPSTPAQQEANTTPSANSSPLQSKEGEDEGAHEGTSSRDEKEGEGKPKLPELTQELIDESPVVAAAVIQAEAAAYSADVAAASQARGAEAQRVAASSMIRGLALAAFILSGGLERSIKIFTTAVQISVERIISAFTGRDVSSSGENHTLHILRTFALRLAVMFALALCVVYVRRWIMGLSAVQLADPTVKATLGQGIMKAAGGLILELQSALIY